METGAALQASDGQRARAAVDGIWLLPSTAGLAFAAIYAASLLGHAMVSGMDRVAPVWLPGAIMLTALLLGPPRAWIAWLVGALAATLVVDFGHGRLGWTSTAFAVTSLLACVLAALAVRRGLGGAPRLDRLRDVVLYLGLAAGLVPLAAVSAGTGCLLLVGLERGFFEVWSTWLLVDVLTHATLTALLLAWLGPVRAPAGISTSGRRLELGLLVVGLIVVSLFLLHSPGGTHDRFPETVFATLPLLLWAALRFGPRGTTLAVATLSVAAILGAAGGHGIVAGLAPAVQHRQVGLLLVAVPLLVVAAVVAERRAAEAALQETVARLARLESVSSVMVAHVGADGRWVKVPRTLCALLGYPMRDVLRRRWQDVADPGHVARDQEEFASVLRGEREAVKREQQYVRRDGSRVLLEVNASRDTDEAAPASRLVLHLRSLTGVKRVEAETRFQVDVLAQVSDVVIAIDLGRRITYWNRRAEQVFGRTAAQARGRPIEELMDIAWPAPSAREADWHDEVTHRPDRGDPLRLELTVSCLQGEDGRLGELVLMRDVTDRRRAEDETRAARRRLQSTMDALPAYVAILDERGLVIAVNAPWGRCARRGGIPDPGVGADYAALCERVQGPMAPGARRIAGAVREMVRGGRTGFRLAYRFDGEGQTRWFRLRMTRFGDADEVRIVLVHENITDLEQAEAGLRDLTGRLLRLQDEERRRIARELHDGAGQNLVALSMNLARLERLARPDARTGGIVADSLQLVEQSLQEMRTLSHVLHPPTLDDVGLTSAVRWYVDGFAKRSGIHVRLDLLPDTERLPQEVESVLFRVIQESLINVHRHSGSGTAAIRLLREPGVVRLDVADEGTGFAAGLREPGDGQGSYGGGLPGIRERLRQLGGRLEIRSDTRGTTVSAVAPLLVENDAAHPAG